MHEVSPRTHCCTYVAWKRPSTVRITAPGHHALGNTEALVARDIFIKPKLEVLGILVQFLFPVKTRQRTEYFRGPGHQNKHKKPKTNNDQTKHRRHVGWGLGLCLEAGDLWEVSVVPASYPASGCRTKSGEEDLQEE